MRFLLNLLAMLVVALAVGFGLSWYALTDGRLFGAIAVGPVGGLAATSARPPPIPTRAPSSRATARCSSGQTEGLQFVAATDSDGRPLDRACRYRIDGHDADRDASGRWFRSTADGATDRPRRWPARLPQPPHRARQ